MQTNSVKFKVVSLVACVAGEDIWGSLRSIHIRRCHAVWLADFCTFISQLPRLTALHIEDMFREAPRGCAR
jgi:hypothetical protein